MLTKKMGRVVMASILATSMGVISSGAWAEDKSKPDKPRAEGADKPRHEKPEGDGKAHAAENAAKIFAKKDKNGDGKLTPDEFKSGLPDERAANADKHFKTMDANGDGVVDLKEFTAAFASPPPNHEKPDGAKKEDRPREKDPKKRGDDGAPNIDDL